MQLCDSHGHLALLDHFGGGPPVSIEQALANARQAGVTLIVNPSTNMADMPQVVDLVARYPDILRAAVGVHPHDAKDWTDDYPARLRVLAGQPGVVAIGEIGLDHFKEYSPAPVQREVFRAQIRLAGELGLPVIVHDRDAHQDVLDTLVAEGAAAHGVVIHCFSGDYAFGQACVDAGFYVSFSGTLTFPNSRDLHEAAARLPLERLLVETDCPYLAPIPYRGKRNQPAYVVETARKLAELRGISLEDAAQVTYENARRVFQVEAERLISP